MDNNQDIVLFTALIPLKITINFFIYISQNPLSENANFYLELSAQEAANVDRIHIY